MLNCSINTLLTTSCERFYADRNVFGFIRDATELMKKNCFKFGCKYYREKKNGSVTFKGDEWG